MNKVLILFLSILSANYGLAQHINYNTGDELQVFAISGLKLRDNPTIEGKPIATMKLGDKVIVRSTADSTQIQNIDGFSGHWVRIKYGEHEGYAFDGFLSGLPVPKEDLMKNNPKSKYLNDPDNELNHEGSEVYDAFEEYIKHEFNTIGKPVSYYAYNNGNATTGPDESLIKISVQQLTRNFVCTQTGGWASQTIELQMPGLRLAEVKNLLTVIAKRSGVDDMIMEKIKANIKKTGEKDTQIPVILELEMNTIRLKRYTIEGNQSIWAISIERFSS